MRLHSVEDVASALDDLLATCGHRLLEPPMKSSDDDEVDSRRRLYRHVQPTGSLAKDHGIAAEIKKSRVALHKIPLSYIVHVKRRETCLS